jgi:hypothetical protein
MEESMRVKANGTFRVKSWEEQPVAEMEGGGRLTRASIGGAYTGDVEGEAVSESVMCYRADGTATFVALERITGRIGERRGSFVLRSDGVYDGNEAKAQLTVVAGSGTGELEGLQGEGRFAAPHGPEGRIELECRFEAE